MVREVTSAAGEAQAVRTGSDEPVAPRDPAASAGRLDELAYVLNHVPTEATKEAAAGVPKLSQTFAKFVVDDKTREVRIQIFDATTGVLVREVPPENLAELADEAKVYQGLLLDHQT